MKRIIAIEGLNYAGKTAICNKLAKENYKVIPEIEVLSGRKNLTEDEYLYYEIKKSYLANKLSKNNYVIMDRSIISSMLYIKSQDKFFETKKINYHQKKVKEEIKNGNIIIPWVFFLNISIETQLKRSKKDQNRDSSFLLSRCFYKFQKEQFEILSREYPNFIFFIDGERKLEEVITEIKEKIKNLKKCTPKIKFENFFSYLFN